MPAQFISLLYTNPPKVTVNVVGLSNRTCTSNPTIAQKADWIREGNKSKIEPIQCSLPELETADPEHTVKLHCGHIP